jgi:CRP/FNR family transcriptional regulator, dissimilatory nitrate respiration regulator
MIEIMFIHLASIPNSVRHLKQDQYLFQAGDRVTSVFVVLTGELHLIGHHKSGGSAILQRALQNSILGEASLFTSSYHCDAVAQSDATLQVFSKATVLEHLRKSPAFAIALAQYLAIEVRHQRQRAEILSLKSVSEKLDAWFESNGALPSRGTVKNVAIEIGVTPEALYREISRRKRRT